MNSSTHCTKHRRAGGALVLMRHRRFAGNAKVPCNEVGASGKGKQERPRQDWLWLAAAVCGYGTSGLAEKVCLTLMAEEFCQATKGKPQLSHR